MTVKPDLHYDARHGWYTFSSGGRIKPLGDKVPFKDRWDAVAYALEQLQSENVSLYAAVVNARQALEKALEEIRDR